MKTVAPPKKASPERQAPPWAKASSKSSKATALISAPEANASEAAVRRLGSFHVAPSHAPRGSAIEAMTAKATAVAIRQH
jgi:hypothetical protein